MSFRYFIDISYDGTNYHGWQIQDNAITIQQVISNCISKILRKQIMIIGAGRTDAGVHAKNYIAHFDINKTINKISDIIYKLNNFLPYDISIHNLYRVQNTIHSRYSALQRTYEYNITTKKNPFIYNYSYYHKKIPDIKLMNKAAEQLYLFEDFTSFSKTGSNVNNNICKIKYAKWYERDNKITFKIIANRFLRNMVRAIVGTLLDVGYNKININDFVNIIRSKNRSNAGFSVPAKGLFLIKIDYPENIIIN